MGNPGVERWAIAEAGYALSYRQIRANRAESLAALSPLYTYLVLCPFIGPADAAAAASGRGQARVQEIADLESTRKFAGEPDKQRVMRVLGARDVSAAEISREVGVALEQVEEIIAGLLEEGSVGPAHAYPDSEPLYRSTMRTFSEDLWSRLSHEERARISEQILDLALGEVEAALESGSFDRRSDRFLSRLELSVDEAGWQRLVEIHDRTLLETIEVQRESAERLASSADPPRAALSLQLMFEAE